PMKRDVLAYVSGVNQFIAKGKSPIEYTLLGAKKEGFSVEDIYNIIGYMAFSFAESLKSEPVLEKIKKDLGENYLKDLPFNYQPGTQKIPVYENDSSSILSQQITEVMKKLPVASWL